MRLCKLSYQELQKVANNQAIKATDQKSRSQSQMLEQAMCKWLTPVNPPIKCEFGTLVHNYFWIVLHSIAVLYSSAAESKLEYGNSLFMCESVCCACVHGMCFYTNAGHAYISVASPSLVSLTITYSIQKHCFLQEFITVRVYNSHMVSIYPPSILSRWQV